MNILRNLLLLAFFAFGLCSCARENENKEKEKNDLHSGEVSISQKQFENAGILLGTVERRNLQNIVKANGFLTLPPQHQASISPYVGGVVKSIFVQAGDYVKRGQTLALLEHPDYIQLQDDYLKAKSNFIFTEKEFNREKELFAKGLSSSQSFQQKESEFSSAKSAHESLKKKIELLNINLSKVDNGEIVSSVPVIAPISGYVQTVGVTLGKYAEPIKEIFSIVDNSQIQLSLLVYEKDIGKVRNGERIYFILPNQTYVSGYASIFSIGRTIDENTKAITVLAKVIPSKDAAKRNLLPGIYVNALIETGMNAVNALPNEAIINEGEKKAVFVLLRTLNDEKGKKFIFGARNVRIGISEAGFTEVTFLEDLSDKTQFVVKGAFFIESEMNKKREGEVD